MRRVSVLIAILGLLSLAGLGAAASSGLHTDPAVENESTVIEVGDAVSIEANITAGEDFLKRAERVNVTLLVDGEPVRSKTLQLDQSDLERARFNHSFSSGGAKFLSVNASYKQGTKTTSKKSEPVEVNVGSSKTRSVIDGPSLELNTTETVATPKCGFIGWARGNCDFRGAESILPTFGGVSHK